MELAVTQLLDVASVVMILLSLTTLVLAGFLSRRYNERGVTEEKGSSRALQISILIVYVPAFLATNLAIGIEGMRLVVGTLMLSGVIPFSLTFLSVWLMVRKPSIVRVQYISYVSWILSLSFSMMIRIPLGWGSFDSLVLNIVIAILFSVLTGAIGGIIGNILIGKMEKYRPSSNSIIG